MSDSLFARADLVLDQSYLLREQRRSLRRTLERERDQLRATVLRSAIARVETKAHRDNKLEVGQADQS